MKAFKPLLALLVLAACTPASVRDKAVPSAVPDAWHHADSLPGNGVTQNMQNWWRGFHDPLLDELIDKALKANQDLKIAVARMRQARAMVVVAESVLYPSIDFSTQGGRQKQLTQIFPVPSANGVTLFTPEVDVVSAGLSAKWEIDMFGANQLVAEAAKARAQGAQEWLGAAQVGLLAELATAYLELRGIQNQTEVFNKAIGLHRKRLKLLQEFYKVGLSNDIDIGRQQAMLHTVEANLSSLTQALEILVHRLGVLTAQQPDSLQMRLNQAPSHAVTLPKLPKLMPGDLLLQRPDLRLAQTEVTAAAANLGKAKADLLPKFNLAVSGGYGTLALGGFPALAETVYALGAGLSAPIFNAGRIRAFISAADARLDEVASAYEKALLIAMEDVENAYVAYASASDRKGRYIQADQEAGLALAKSDAFYQRGLVNYLSVLDVQKEQLAIAQERVKSETAQAVAVVSLYRAMGGGWAEVMPSPK